MRKTGILLPIFSLASKYGIGDFGEGAYRFVDFLETSGQSYWQILPIVPTTVGDSPYQSPSSYGGNPYFISPEILIKEELLHPDEAKICENKKKIDYAHLYNTRYLMLKKAFARFNKNDKKYLEFCEKNKDWLPDHSLYFALKKHFNLLPFNEWNDGIKHRVSSDMEHYRDRFGEDIEFHNFVQYKFYDQWMSLKKYANEKGIKIIGDIPIYVSYDSSDVWKNPELFQLDENLLPEKVAGCPPDNFAKDGQLWGNPLYRWSEHKKDNYAWWKKRLRHTLTLFDVVRIDHFRGFDEYYAIPYGEETARNGEWKKGPGIELFNAIGDTTDKENIIAEDLGFITPSVRKLLADTGYSGMKILQFAFDERDEGDKSEHLPHNYPENSVAYTGTHDNQTLLSWVSTITETEFSKVRDYLCDYYTPKEKLNFPLISEILKSPAKLTIIPMQDYLELSDEARINTPGNPYGNWDFRINFGELNSELSEKIRKMTKIYGRK